MTGPNVKLGSPAVGGDGLMNAAVREARMPVEA
jgi:hypothetical protein